VDLENFATASRRYTGDIHNSTVVGLFMTPETMGADSVASWSQPFFRDYPGEPRPER